METRDLDIIGNNTYVCVAGINKIPAKIDTGADSSSIWASNLRMNDDGLLEFCLFGPESPLYTGEVLTSSDFRVKQVRSSNGQISVRYCVPLSLRIDGHNIKVYFTLSDRAKNRFPVLIGRKTLQNKFLVDVAKIKIPRPATLDNKSLNEELERNPQDFHKKHMS